MRVISILGSDYSVKEIAPNHQALSKEVGGVLTTFYLGGPLKALNVIAYADNEGLFKDNPILTLITLNNNQIIETIYGRIVIAGFEPETGETISLTDFQLDDILKRLELDKYYYITDNKGNRCYTLQTG